MEENQLKPKKIIINYGLLLGAALIVFSLMLFSMDMQYEQGLSIQGVQFLLITVAVIIAIFQFKKVNGGFLKLSEALKIGAGVAVIGGVMGVIYFFIFSNFVEPDFLTNLFEIGKQQAMAANPEITPEQMDQGIAFQRKIFPIILIAGILFQVIFALIVGLITGLIAKKEPSNFSS